LKIIFDKIILFWQWESNVKSMPKYTEEISRTFDEFLLLPGLTRKDCTPESVSLRTPLVKHARDEEPRLALNLPFTSAIMQAVSGTRTATALATEGGLSFIFGSQPIWDQARMVADVKSHKAGFVTSRANLTPDMTLADLVELSKKTGHSTIAITHDGSPNGRLLWVVTGRDWRPGHTPMDTRMETLMTPIGKLIVGEEKLTLTEANDFVWKEKLNSLPILGKEWTLKHFVFRKDYESQRVKPNQVTDNDKKLLVGAGINSRDYAERADALIKSGVDILCIDSSDGFSEWQAETLRVLKNEYNNDVLVWAGNVVDKDAFLYLVEAGADFVKVGIGGGSICITREEKWIGRGQATALREIVETRDEYFKEKGIYIPICSDWGIVHDRHTTMALAMGADFLMMWRYFAQFDESPGRKIIVEGSLMKEYWGEGSWRARNPERYAEWIWNESSFLKFAEWVDGCVPALGPMAETLQTTVAKINATMVSCGSNNLADFTRDARITLVSAASLKEGWTGNVTIKK